MHIRTQNDVDQAIDDIINCLSLDLDILELIEAIDAELNDSDYSLTPIYDEQGFFYSYAM